MPIPNERGETYKDVIHAWYPIHKARMQQIHHPACAELEIVEFFETIEIESKIEQERLAKLEAEKDIIMREAPEGADE